MEQLAALRKRQSHLRSKVDGLVVRAPLDGVVLGRRQGDLLGQFLEVGTPLMKIAREKHKEIQVSISEAHFDTFSQKVGTIPHVRIPGRSGAVRAGQLTKVEPRATVVLRNQLLGGTYGGPLAVREAQSDENQSESGNQKIELVAPRFHGVIALSADESARLKSGQLAKVRIYDASETIGRRAYRAVHSWIQQKLNQCRMAAQAS